LGREMSSSLLALASAAVSPTPRSMSLNPDPSAPVPFNYHYEIAPGQHYRIHGFAPPTGSGHPVYLYGGGHGHWGTTSQRAWYALYHSPEVTFPWEMAQRGYVAAIMEIEVLPANVFTCSDDSMAQASRRLFAYGGPGDTVNKSALATVCRHPQANCSAGIALHGHSISGLMVSVAPKVVRGVTAVLVFSAGSMVPFAWSCCGRMSEDSSCCTSGQLAGGSSLPCATYDAMAPYIHKSRRRFLMARDDHNYGDCHMNRTAEQVARMEGGLYVCHYDVKSLAYTLARQDSGYDCGEGEFHCLAADGSGYYLVTGHGEDFLGADAYNSHNWFKLGDGADDSLSEGFLGSPMPWGVRANMNWLALTGRRQD